MSNVGKMFGTDDSLEKEGVVIDYGEFQIRIARAGGSNQKFNRLLEAKTKPHRRIIETENMDQKLANKLLMEVYSKTVVLGWEGVKDDKGKDIPFTPEACLNLFKDNRDFFDDIQAQATRAALFRTEVLAVEAGNS